MIERIDVNIAGGLDIPLPRMVSVRQKVRASRLANIPETVSEQFKRPEIASKIKPGQRIAVGCSSRGIANIQVIVKAVVDGIKSLGGEPFLFPAMGSHGASNAEGQRQVLEDYGLTEEAVGASIRATMDTRILGQLDSGVPVHADAYAAEADGIVLVNRIKPHTSFRGDIESGVVKMMTIGMGKIRGATALHSQGMDHFPVVLPEAARLIMREAPFRFGIGIVENAHDDTMLVEAIAAEHLLQREAVLQAIAKDAMGRLAIDDIDVLVIDEMGKNISGAGFDPNVTGRNNRGIDGFDTPRVQRIVVLDLTDASHGNAAGLSLADVITMKLFRKIDFSAFYANIIASAYLDGGAVPLIMNTSREAVALAVKSVPRVESLDCRVVRVRNTLAVTHFEVSEILAGELLHDSGFDVLGEPEPWTFDELGELTAAPAAALHAAGGGS